MYSFDASKIGEWLVYLENSVPEDAYQFMLKRSGELDKASYGMKVSSPRSACELVS